MKFLNSSMNSVKNDINFKVQETKTKKKGKETKTEMDY